MLLLISSVKNILLQYITWLPHFGRTRQIIRYRATATLRRQYNSQNYSLGESILLAKIKQYALLYILSKFQRVCMTTFFFELSVLYRSLIGGIESSHIRIFVNTEEFFLVRKAYSGLYQS